MSLSRSVARDLAPSKRLRISGSTSLIRYALVLRLSKSSNADMNNVIPSGDGIFTCLWTILTSSLSILEMNLLSWSMSKSPVRISLIASRMITDPSICLCFVIMASAFCWNCFGLTSSAPILLGFNMLLDETSLNLLEKSWESIMYLWRISSLVSFLNTSGILEISTS